MTTDGRQLDAFVTPSRVGGLLEVARDEMLERLERGEPVAWVAVGNALVSSAVDHARTFSPAPSRTTRHCFG